MYIRTRDSGADCSRRGLPGLLLVFSLLSACTLPTKQSEAELAMHASGTEGYAVLDMNRAADLRQVMDRLAERRVILVGETHDRVDHHRVQLAALEAAWKQTPDLAIGVEWFQRPYQAALDDYIAGRIDEARLLRDTEYYTRWRFDFRLYQPILRFARSRGIPVIALNASSELVDRVREQGLTGLDAATRARLPAVYDHGDAAYTARLRRVFDSHPVSEGRKFAHFVDVQLTWDETMAETAAAWLEANPGKRMLVFAGAGHVMFGSGIPDRIARRLQADSATILVAGEDTLQPGAADFLVVSEAETLPRGGLMGAFLEDSEQGLRIAGLSEGGALKDAGVGKGAILLRIEGTPVPDYASLKLLMQDRKPGDEVVVEYRETGQAGDLPARKVHLKLR